MFERKIELIDGGELNFDKFLFDFNVKKKTFEKSYSKIITSILL